MQENFKEIKSLNWNLLKIPNAINLGISALIFAGLFFAQSVVPISKAVDALTQNPFLLFLIPGSVIIYIVLHELIHGLFMRMFSGIAPDYGVSGPFVFAKSEAYFSKNAYSFLALAPVLLLGISAAFLLVIIPNEAIWLAIFIWSFNLYASRGDLQAVSLLKEWPNDTYIKDEGDLLRLYKKIK